MFRPSGNVSAFGRPGGFAVAPWTPSLHLYCKVLGKVPEKSNTSAPAFDNYAQRNGPRRFPKGDRKALWSAVGRNTSGVGYAPSGVRGPQAETFRQANRRSFSPSLRSCSFQKKLYKTASPVVYWYVTPALLPGSPARGSGVWITCGIPVDNFPETGCSSGFNNPQAVFHRGGILWITFRPGPVRTPGNDGSGPFCGVPGHSGHRRGSARLSPWEDRPAGTRIYPQAGVSYPQSLHRRRALSRLSRRRLSTVSTSPAATVYIYILQQERGRTRP